MHDKSEDVDHQYHQSQNKKPKNTAPPVSPPSYRLESNSSRSIKNNKKNPKSRIENFLKMFPDMKQDILLLILKKGCDNDVIAATNLLQQCRPIHHHTAGPPPLATSASLVTVSYDRYQPPNHLYLEGREMYHPHCKECQSHQRH